MNLPGAPVRLVDLGPGTASTGELRGAIARPAPSPSTDPYHRTYPTESVRRVTDHRRAKLAEYQRALRARRKAAAA